MTISTSQRRGDITRRRTLAQLAACSCLPFAMPAQAAAMPEVQARFDLVSHRGERLDESAMRGSASLVVFGFTGCPDVCPTTLFEITQLYRAMGRDGDRLKTFFITVDPDNDTPARLALYLQSFDPRIVGLTGPRPRIDAALSAFLAHAEKIDSPAGATWSHSSGVYAFDAAARFIDFLDLAAGPGKALRDLRPYLAAR